MGMCSRRASARSARTVVINTGRPDSAARRLELLKQLELPEHMSANALLNVLNGCYSREEARELLGLS